ncbi:MAG: tetratricopeptide repeat protein [Filifactoraceae bacterium]
MIEFFEKSKINDYFKQYADDLIFINLSKEKLEKDFGISEEEFLIPIKKTKIINMAKSKYQEITTSSIIEGILTILGSDFNFIFNSLYVKLLKLKVPELEKTIQLFISEDIKNKRLYDGILKLRAYLGFINDEDLKVKSYYGLICKEIYLNSKNKKNMINFLEEAKSNFRVVYEKNLDDGLVAYELAYIYVNEGRVDEAKEVLEKGIKTIKDEALLKDAITLLNNLQLENELVKVEVLIEELKVKEAIIILNKLEAVTQVQKYKVLYSKGYCYNILGDIDMALKMYEEAILINNMDPKLLSAMGLIYGYLGEYEQSLELYFAALNLEPRNITILCNLSILLMNLGDYKNSREFLDRALEIDDKDDIVISCLKEIRKFE